MDADGSNPRQLLPGEAGADHDPDWAPDGRRIVYASDRSGNFEIFTADLDTGVALQLTDNQAMDGNPSWSPDGKRIAFSSDRTGNWDVFVMDADGSDVRNLTNDPADDSCPDWSPDGEKIAFSSNRYGYKHLFEMGIDSADFVWLTETEGDEVCPQWSPDGTALADTVWGDQVSILYLDSGEYPGLTEGKAPTWSPTGERIAYTCLSDQICVVGSDGTGQVILTAHLRTDPLPSLSVPTIEYVAAVGLPGVLLLVLLIPLGSRMVYVRRHAQQAVFFAALRVLSTVLIVGLSRGQLIALWVVVNGGLWLFGGVWGLRQVRRGDCWLMRVRGEGSELPRPWAVKPALPPAGTSAAISPGLSEAHTGEEGQEATIERLRQMLRTGSPQERQWAIASLQALGEIEEF
jgi:TolB protein